MTAPSIPPFWAEPALRTLLPRDRADDVTGDLLETFRDTPSLSQSAVSGELWFGRQIASVFLRAYWLFPLTLAAAFVTNDMSNTFRDATGAPRIPDILGGSIVAVFLAAGVFGGWRTRRVLGGAAAAAGTHLFAWTFMTAWWAVTTYPFALQQRDNPYWVRAWQSSSTTGETFIHWIVWDNVGAVLLGGSILLLFSLALGLVGGATGGYIRGRRQQVGA